MVYSFLYSMDNLTKEQKLQAIKKLNDQQFEILEHIYLNSNMPEKSWLKAYIEDGLDFTLDCPITSISDIINCSKAKPRDTELLAEGIVRYLYAVEDFYGPKEGRKAAQVIFRQKKIPGIRARDIIEERSKRCQEKSH